MGGKMKNKKEKKKTNFNYSEEFITSIPNPTEQELKAIFNKKYFNYIKRNEKRMLGSCNFE